MPSETTIALFTSHIKCSVYCYQNDQFTVLLIENVKSKKKKKNVFAEWTIWQLINKQIQITQK